jgi:hypothetical protein
MGSGSFDFEILFQELTAGQIEVLKTACGD